MMLIGLKNYKPILKQYPVLRQNENALLIFIVQRIGSRVVNLAKDVFDVSHVLQIH
jgi:hypothetical protein